MPGVIHSKPAHSLRISGCRSRGEHTCRIFPPLTQPFNILLLYLPAVSPDWLCRCTVMYALAFNWMETIYEACLALFLLALAHFVFLSLSFTHRGWLSSEISHEGDEWSEVEY